MTQTNSNATKIMIIRHAEKPLENPPTSGVEINGTQNQDSLIVQGWQRAGALVTLFAPARGPLQDPHLATPQFIYAAKVSKSSDPKKGSASSDPEEGNRPQQTVKPLIDQLQKPPVNAEGGMALQLNFTFEKDSVAEVAQSAISCDGIVLISWPHGQIPNLAHQIPPSPNSKHKIPKGKWPGDRFDIVWVFDLDTSLSTVGYIFRQVPQLLLAGDSPEPIT